MRYQWLPYNYTLAYENASRGLPLARPLNFQPENYDEKYANVDDEYLWGDNVLVAPVFAPGMKERTVLFPSGEWYSWWNPRKIYKGGTSAKVPAPLDKLPLFVRAGSFIPQYTRPIENVTEYDPRFLTVVYFPSDKPSEYTLFEDDRKSPVSLQTGDYRLTTFSAHMEDGRRIIEAASRGSYPGMPESQSVTLKIPGIECPKTIDQYEWRYDREAQTLYIMFEYDGRPVRIEI